ncbi:MAG: ankyrin repeat domain-containing protein [Candidatus Anstonellales archaeon]
MDLKDEEEKKMKGHGQKGRVVGGFMEGRRLGKEEVMERVIKAVIEGREDNEAFEELRRINRERKGEDKRRAERLGEELVESIKKENSLKDVVRLILEGADLDVKGDLGRTALIRAIEYERKNIPEVLIKAGANVDLQDNVGNNALWWAVKSEDKKTVEMLVNAGADVDLQDDDGMTALMWVVYWQREEIVKFLLQNGANPFLKNKNGETALYVAYEEQWRHNTTAINNIINVLEKHIDNMDEGVKKRMEKEAELRFGLKECNKEKAKGLILELLGS